MRGLKKHALRMDRHTDTRTDGHRDSMTDQAQREESVKILLKFYIYLHPLLRLGLVRFDVVGLNFSIVLVDE